VADQFLVRVGAAVPIPNAQGLAFALAGRLEGVPLAVKRRTFRSVGSAPDYQDATLADYILLASFSRRFGGRDERPIRRLPRDDDDREFAAVGSAPGEESLTPASVPCPACSHGMAASAKFWSECGARMTPVAAPVIEAGTQAGTDVTQDAPKSP
jgi:hypothetical protein